jgi:hypothetical protein
MITSHLIIIMLKIWMKDFFLKKFINESGCVPISIQFWSKMYNSKQLFK